MFDDDYINSPAFEADFNRGQLRANSLLLDMVEMLASGETETKPTAKVVQHILNTVHRLIENQAAEDLGFLTHIAYQALRFSCHQHNMANEQAIGVMDELRGALNQWPPSPDLPPKT